MGLIALDFLLVMVTAGVTIYFSPKEYFSKVTMEVKTDNSGSDQRHSAAAMQRCYDPQFVATQFQILQKTEILYPVIERLELVKNILRWRSGAGAAEVLSDDAERHARRSGSAKYRPDRDRRLTARTRRRPPT